MSRIAPLPRAPCYGDERIISFARCYVMLIRFCYDIDTREVAIRYARYERRALYHESPDVSSYRSCDMALYAPCRADYLMLICRRHADFVAAITRHAIDLMMLLLIRCRHERATPLRC